MKLLCFIDSLGSGGAQRQLATLAVGLKTRRHQVRFLVYHPQDHFLPLLQAADIPCQVILSCPYAQRALAVRRILRKGWQDVVLAFLEAPNLYAELAGLPSQKWGLVVGERSADPDMGAGRRRWLRWPHRFADAVVANSHTNRLMLERAWPGLRPKLSTIYNTVDFQMFHPVSEAAPTRSNAFRVVVAASYQHNKNMMGVAQALLQIKKSSPSLGLVVDWYGAMPSGHAAYDQAARFVGENGLNGTLNLHPAIATVEREYATAGAVGLFSFFEGLPNAVCEAMACGKPILLSNVCDAGNLVWEGRNGFLCDPHSPASIASAMSRMAALSSAERLQMGLESRLRAEQLFDVDAVVGRYERILESAARCVSLPAGCSWPMEVPGSAVAAVGRSVRHSPSESVAET